MSRQKFLTYILISTLAVFVSSTSYSTPYSTIVDNILSLSEGPSSKSQIVRYKSNHAKKEAFVYKFALEMGLGDVVAPVALLEQDEIILKKINFIPEGLDIVKLPSDLQEFVETFKPTDNTLYLSGLEGMIEKLSEPDKKKYKKIIAKYFDTDNVQQLFLFQSLVHNNDFGGRTINISVTTDHKLWLTATSHLGAFSRFSGPNNFTVTLPVNDQPLRPELQALIQLWPERVKSYRRELKQFQDGWNDGYELIHLRTQALANYTKSFPHHDIRKIHALAFLPINNSHAYENANGMSQGYYDNYLENANNSDLGFYRKFGIRLDALSAMVRTVFHAKGSLLYDNKPKKQTPENLPTVQEIFTVLEKDPLTAKFKAEQSYYQEFDTSSLGEFFNLNEAEPARVAKVTLPEVAPPIVPRKKKIKPVVVDPHKIGEHLSAADRLEKMKEYFLTYPDLKSGTKIDEIVYDFYLPDLAFVKEQLKKRDPYLKTYDRELKKIEKYVSEHFKNFLSMQDYHAISEVFVDLLSLTKESDYDYVGNHMEAYNRALEIFDYYGEKINVNMYNVRLFQYINSPFILVPVVSETGEVPVLTMNEGFGFFLDGRARSVDFLAVGTDKLLNYDYNRCEKCYAGRYHDWGHLERNNRIGGNSADHLKRVTNIARFRKAMYENITDETKLMQAELAFFDFFHETQDPRRRIGDDLEKQKESYMNKMTGEIVPTTHFNSIEQYESYVEAAKSLGLEIDDKDIIEQYRDFLRHLVEGYKLLEPLARVHDHG